MKAKVISSSAIPKNKSVERSASIFCPLGKGHLYLPQNIQMPCHSFSLSYFIKLLRDDSYEKGQIAEMISLYPFIICIRK